MGPRRPPGAPRRARPGSDGAGAGLAAHGPGGGPAARRRTGPGARGDVPGGRERLGQVDAGRGGGGGVRPERRGRDPLRTAPDPALGVTAGVLAAAGPRCGRAALGVLPAGREHARLLHLPGAGGRAGRLPRAEPRRVVPGAGRAAPRQPRTALPRRAEAALSFTSVLALVGRLDALARTGGQVLCATPLPRALRAAGRPDPRGRPLGACGRAPGTTCCSSSTAAASWLRPRGTCGTWSTEPRVSRPGRPGRRARRRRSRRARRRPRTRCSRGRRRPSPRGGPRAARRPTAARRSCCPPG